MEKVRRDNSKVESRKTEKKHLIFAPPAWVPGARGDRRRVRWEWVDGQALRPKVYARDSDLSGLARTCCNLLLHARPARERRVVQT